MPGAARRKLQVKGRLCGCHPCSGLGAMGGGVCVSLARGGGSGEQLRGTQERLRLGDDLLVWKGKGGAGPTPREEEGLGQDWGL